MLTNPNCPDCYGSGVIVHAEGDVAWTYCHCAVGIPDDEPDETIVKRPAYFTTFVVGVPSNLCQMCGGSLTDGIRKCVCKAKRS